MIFSLKEFKKHIYGLIEARKYTDAIGLLDEFLLQNPQSAWGIYQKSILLINLGKDKDAQILLDDLLKKHPDNPYFLLARGSLYARANTKKTAEQVKYLQRAAELRPHMIDTWRNLAGMASLSGEADIAEQAIYKALALAPNDFVAHNNANRILYNKNNFIEARAHGATALFLKDKAAMQKISHYIGDAHIKVKPRYDNGQGDAKKNIIAFSLWGDKKTYIQGMVENIELAKKFYENWTVRIYLDDSVQKDARDKFLSMGAEIVELSDKLKKTLVPGAWRFLVHDDENVNYFMCRDADARINKREVEAVRQWQDSGKDFHIMRDHIRHTALIMAGMWGGRARAINHDIRPLLGKFFKNSTHHWDDQLFLADVIWPLIKENCLIHDHAYNLFGAQPFPIPRKDSDNEHIGGGYHL